VSHCDEVVRRQTAGAGLENHPIMEEKIRIGQPGVISPGAVVDAARFPADDRWWHDVRDVDCCRLRSPGACSEKARSPGYKRNIRKRLLVVSLAREFLRRVVPAPVFQSLRQVYVYCAVSTFNSPSALYCNLKNAVSLILGRPGVTGCSTEFSSAM